MTALEREALIDGLNPTEALIMLRYLANTTPAFDEAASLLTHLRGFIATLTPGVDPAMQTGGTLDGQAVLRSLVEAQRTNGGTLPMLKTGCADAPRIGRARGVGPL